MPFHSIIVANSAGNLLLARHWDRRLRGNAVEAKNFEDALYQNTNMYMRLASSKQSVSFMDVHVVFCAVSDLVLYVCGTGDVDEFQQSEALDVLVDIMKTNFDGNVCEEQAMKAENVGKLCVCIDEMITDGVLETLDVDTINKMSKLKHFA